MSGIQRTTTLKLVADRASVVMRRDPLATTRERLGFRDGDRGTHASRTIMLSDLRILLDACPPKASREDYRVAIVEQNVLARRTRETRRVTAQKLFELYGLDGLLPVFRGLRKVWSLEKDAQPLLALLCASARDPLLRLSAGTVLPASVGEEVAPSRFASELTRGLGERFSKTTLEACVTRLASSWSQSGHLSSGRARTRCRPARTIASASYAMFLAYLEGFRGQRLLSSAWAHLLDVQHEDLVSLLQAASQRGHLVFRSVGSVVEVRFDDWLSKAEQEFLREPR